MTGLRRSAFALILTLILALVSGCSTPPKTQNRDLAATQPFGTALVISGENLNTPLFIGMLDGLEEQGKKVDLIVASCGGSIAAAFYKAVPHREERLKILTSPEYYELIRDLQMDDPSLLQFAKRIWRLRRIASRQEEIKETGKRFAPDIFSYSLLRLKEEITQAKGLNLKAPFSNQGTRVVILGARVDYSPAEANQEVPASRKLYTETLFTDVETAKFLIEFPSLVGSLVPTSSLSPQTALVTTATLGEAVRASITDPLLVNPEKFEGHDYLTGAVNIDPINVARHLAKEVIARYPTIYSQMIEQPALMATFAFNGNEIRSKVLKTPIDFWIDGTTDFPNFSLGAKPNIWGAIKDLNLARTYKFGTRLPDSYEEFKKLVMRQYEFGMSRAKEALAAPRYSQGHILNLIK